MKLPVVTTEPGCPKLEAAAMENLVSDAFRLGVSIRLEPMRDYPDIDPDAYWGEDERPHWANADDGD